MSRLWILGAPDPEMTAIEKLLRDAGETFIYATCDGRRVHPGNAYKADGPRLPDGVSLERTFWVECECPLLAGMGHLIDHHREGDPGHGLPPAEFLRASSIGQVISTLADLGSLDGLWLSAESSAADADPDEVEVGDLVRWGRDDSWAVVTGLPNREPDYPGEHVGFLAADIPKDLILTAAADHCLRAAYKGLCPGVSPEDLMEFRVRTRAEFQGVDPKTLMERVKESLAGLRDAPRLTVGDYSLADMRGRVWPELPEAGTRSDQAYMAGPLNSPDGREKFTVSGTPEIVKAWMDCAEEAWGLTGIYGDPARGFAGGYKS